MPSSWLFVIGVLKDMRKAAQRLGNRFTLGKGKIRQKLNLNRRSRMSVKGLPQSHLSTNDEPLCHAAVFKGLPTHYFMRSY